MQPNPRPEPQQGRMTKSADSTSPSSDEIGAHKPTPESSSDVVALPPDGAGGFEAEASAAFHFRLRRLAHGHLREREVARGTKADQVLKLIIVSVWAVFVVFALSAFALHLSPWAQLVSLVTVLAGPVAAVAVAAVHHQRSKRE